MHTYTRIPPYLSVRNLLEFSQFRKKINSVCLVNSMPVRFSINFSIYISVRVDRAEKTLRPGLVVGRHGAPRLLQLRTGGHLRGPQRRRDRFARGLPSQRTDVGVCQLLRARP